MSRGTVTISVEEYDGILKLKNDYVLGVEHDNVVAMLEDELKERDKEIKEKDEEIKQLREGYAFQYLDINGFLPYKKYFCKEDIQKIFRDKIVRYKRRIASSNIFQLLELRKECREDLRYLRDQ